MNGVQIAAAGRTDPGRTRADNQDTFIGLDLMAPEPFTPMLAPDPETGRGEAVHAVQLGAGGALFIVADGMGGAAGGATASRLAVRTVADVMTAEWSRSDGAGDTRAFARGIRDAVLAANRSLFERAASSPELRGMGTTFTGAGVLGSSLVLAQVGDSRAYLIRGGRIGQLTRDQSLVQEIIDSGAMSPEEARNSPNRNVILQALGTADKVDVVITTHELRRGDVVMLCSDGLCGVVPDEMLARMVADAGDLAEACAQLIDAANDAGGPDNITVVLARMDGAGLRPPDPRAEIRGVPLDPDGR